MRYQNYGDGYGEVLTGALITVSVVEGLSRLRGDSNRGGEIVMRCALDRSVSARSIGSTAAWRSLPRWVRNPGRREPRPWWPAYSAGSYRVSDYLGAPGLYGMSYGFASYGMPQTYSVFSAYPGAVLRNELSTLRGHARSVWRRPVAAGIRRPGLRVRGLLLLPAASYSYRTFAVGYGPG